MGSDLNFSRPCSSPEGSSLTQTITEQFFKCCSEDEGDQAVVMVLSFGVPHNNKEKVDRD